ncbi:hypothetical protein K2173_003165 [Erythroxylum novogranatense]|uniref:1-acyl-sn-glycerol-3-phosphate acyltransferase n=1 Tax=Erythroxylum novogranatense TaxID=1862640 RepID=A0AAV8TAH0_9ROSI|nr:hypothetical protein K2173_003165 [Erythroxylum novogranatense]
MENAVGGFMRNRRLASLFSTDSSSQNVIETSRRVKTHEEVEQRPRNDDGWISVFISYMRIVTCFLAMMVTTMLWALIMLLLLPWPYERIRQGNIYGHFTDDSRKGFWLQMWILGNPMKIEFSNEKAIYISNHASPIDIFLMMWLVPTGTVGIAKKEIIWYPLFGQLYVLANHLRIDRSNSTAAVRSMKEAARAVVENKLSLIIFPKGTRSKNGRLLPFKKGFVHLALQTRLPVVPMVLTGTHVAWRKGSLRVRPAPISIKSLPPITTQDWTDDKIDDYIKLVHNIHIENLPKSQRPLSLS